MEQKNTTDLSNQNEIIEKIEQMVEEEGYLFETVEEKKIGGKAVGAYVAVLSTLLTKFMNENPEHQEEISNIIGKSAAICVKHIL